MNQRARCGRIAFLAALMCASTAATAGTPAQPRTCTGAVETSRALLERRVALSLERVALHVVVERLLSAGVPISFVDARAENLEEPLVSVFADAADTLEHTLAALLDQAKSYRCTVFDGHLLLYPSLAKYEQIMRGVEIAQLPRIRAVWKYTESLNAHAAGFEELASQPVRGYPLAPLYVEPVTLQPEARVLDHLAQLLGSNSNVVFSVERSCPDDTCRGARLWFSELRVAQAGRP